MNADKLESIFGNALAQPTPEARTRYLSEACAEDAELRQRVEALLKAHDDAGKFLDPPAVATVPTSDEIPGRFLDPADPALGRGLLTTPPAAEALGTRIGPYKLLQLLGEGGMGAVYMAEQQEPVKRRVALKIIKAGFDSDRVIARFEAERQALAMMDHPNIAKVLDAGTTDAGRPYFVMELVKGIPITKFCDQEHLTPKERLDLFIPVCHTVQHAHQKGIIHRDIKPSNVLIALYDGKPVPKVIDFGVAKATAQKLTERTMFTEVGQIVGTLEYMAPEQAELNNLDIDTRADIYSLGVLLYELLTGSPPFSSKQLRSVAFTEMLRMIRESEPPKPSTRLSSSEELPTIAAKRKLEPAKLAKLVKGDLDWIVMKALEKDRGRRYETANGLALDVQRYLADEPVLASPPSAGYRIRKFVRKHRGPVLAAGIISLLLTAGTVGTTIGLLRAERLREVAVRNEKDALAEKLNAEKSQQQALDALKATTDDVMEHLIGARPEMGPTEKEFVKRALKRWKVFAAEQGMGERAQVIRAQGVFRIGTLRHKLSLDEEARADFLEAIQQFERLAAYYPGVPENRSDLASCYSSLGTVLFGLGNYPEAEANLQRSVEVQEVVAKEVPEKAAFRFELSRSLNNLAGALASLGRNREAEAAHRRGLLIQEKLLTDSPLDPEYRQELAKSRTNLGNLLERLNKFDEAELEARKAVNIYAKLAAEFSEKPRFRAELAVALNNLGSKLFNHGKPKDAEDVQRKALMIQEDLVSHFPSVPQYGLDLARSHSNAGYYLSERGKREEAEGSTRRALDIHEKLAAEFPTATQYRFELAKSLDELGVRLTEPSKRNEAEAAYRRAISTLEKLVSESPARHEYRWILANSLMNLAVLLAVQEKRQPEAEAIYRQSLTVLEQLVAEFPFLSGYSLGLARVYGNLGALYRGLGRRPDAEATCLKAVAIAEKLVADYPEIPKFKIELAGTRVNLGHFYKIWRKSEEAVKEYDQAIPLLEEVLRAIKVHALAQTWLRAAYLSRAAMLVERKKYAEALDDWAKAEELTPPLLRPQVRSERGTTLVRAGRVEEALKVADELAQIQNNVILYNAACVFALAADRQDESAGSISKAECAKRAIALLEQAVAKGFKDAEHMKKDDDLKALRERDDFKKLLAELERTKVKQP
jgi:serine/threonine protein kinase/tetratricopeptide (TPR) repeat protein